jgi:hypothetical protein
MTGQKAPTLGYASPQSERGRRWWIAGLTCMLWLLVGTPVALVLGIASAGAGHGDYVSARLLFPYTMLSTYLTSDLTLVLAVIQMPVYGVVLFLASLRGGRRFVVALIVVGGLHLVASLLCFVPPLPCL